MSLPMNFVSWDDYDKESTQWQFYKLFTSPEDVFRHIRSHRNECGYWARKNFKFAFREIVILSLILLVWFVLPGFQHNFETLIFNELRLVVFSFIIIGAFTGKIFSVLLNKFGLANRSNRESRQDVEWLFCFDAFCNGYVALIIDFFLGYQIIYLISLLFKNYFFVLFLPNTLLCIASCHFLYLFVQTLNVLPFIKRLPYLLFFVPVILVYLLSLIFSWPIARCWVLHIHQ